MDNFVEHQDRPMRDQPSFFSNGSQRSEFATPTPSNGRKRFFNQVDSPGNNENTPDPSTRSYEDQLFPAISETAHAHQNLQTPITNDIVSPPFINGNTNIHDDLQDDISDEMPLTRKPSARVIKPPNALSDYVTEETAPNTRYHKSRGGSRGTSRGKSGGNHGGASGSR